MKKNILLFFLSFFMLVGYSQQLDLEQLKNIKTRSIGPAGMSGRVTSIDVVTENPQVMYAGTASGGAVEICKRRR